MARLCYQLDAYITSKYYLHVSITYLIFFSLAKHTYFDIVEYRNLAIYITCILNIYLVVVLVTQVLE